MKACLCASTGVPAGQLPEEHWREAGQRCDHLHAHDSRAARCHGQFPICILLGDAMCPLCLMHNHLPATSLKVGVEQDSQDCLRLACGCMITLSRIVWKLHLTLNSSQETGGQTSFRHEVQTAAKSVIAAAKKTR